MRKIQKSLDFLNFSSEIRFLFLDRDGVINRQREGAYVEKWADFQWIEGVLAIFPKLARRFERICLLTNQQGLGKGLMSQADLNFIHARMTKILSQAGGRMDGIFVCPHLAEAQCQCRKPKGGLAWQAKAKFPEIEFKQSLFIGDSPSDIELGLKLGMKVLMLHPNRPCPPQVPRLNNLAELQDYLNT